MYVKHFVKTPVKHLVKPPVKHLVKHAYTSRVRVVYASARVRAYTKPAHARARMSTYLAKILVFPVNVLSLTSSCARSLDHLSELMLFFLGGE